MANGQRRDIERRLHDGIQQDLVALAVNLQWAEEAVASDPAELRRLVGEMRQDVHEAIETVRALARGVYPPLLTDMGLAAALRGISSGASIPVQVEAPPGRYPPDVEAAVYFSCLDAVQAIPPGGPASEARVHVWRDEEALLFEVTIEGWTASNNGSQLDTIATAIGDRVGAVGGTVSASAEAERALVRGAIPLGSGA